MKKEMIKMSLLAKKKMKKILKYRQMMSYLLHVLFAVRHLRILLSPFVSIISVKNAP
jgi:hypothetical protein